MSTRRVWKQSEIKTNPLFSKMRSTIETAFYGKQCNAYYICGTSVPIGH